MNPSELLEWMTGDGAHINRRIRPAGSCMAVGFTSYYVDDDELGVRMEAAVAQYHFQGKMPDDVEVAGFNFWISDTHTASRTDNPVDVATSAVWQAVSEIFSTNYNREEYRVRGIIVMLVDPSDIEDVQILRRVGYVKITTIPNGDDPEDHPYDDVYILTQEAYESMVDQFSQD